MGTGQWIAVAVGVSIAAIATGALVWRHRLVRGPRADRIPHEARRALRALAGDQRRRRKGSLRGEGYGGDDNLATAAGVASDSGGAPCD